MGKGIKGLILGGAVGAAIGILYAPRAGKKTRAMIAKKTDAVLNSSSLEENKIFGEVAKTTKNAVEAGQNFISAAQNTKFGEFTKGASEKGQKIFKETANFVEGFATENVKPIFTEKNDDLRKKIDNARSKIASQVANNIQSDSQPAPIQATSKKKVVRKTANKTTKKTAAKKPAPKRIVVKKYTKSASKPVASKTSAAKKVAPKKTAAKKTVAKKPATKTTTAKKATAKKSTAKGTTAKRATAKKPTTKTASKARTKSSRKK